MELRELARGLWRWTARHPDWEPRLEEDDPADWAPDVGCVAYEAGDGLVLIDPLVDNGDYGALDELANGKREVAILTTIRWHGRSGAELATRYSASAETPDAVDPVEIPGAAETMFWIPEHRALVPGDRLLGDRPPRLRMCPPSWLHGEPVLDEGRAAIDRALAG
jgi:hypothetical protein